MESSAPGAPIVAPNVRDLAELADQLTRWLGTHMPDATDIRLENFRYPRGAGQSHETILFDAQWREGDDTRSSGLVVRIKPTDFTVYLDDMFVEQYEIMRALHADGRIPVAKVRWLEKDPGVIGAPFFVMDQLQGKVAVSHPPYMRSGWIADATPEQRSKLWEQSVHALGALQTIPLDAFDFLGREDGVSGFMQEWNRWDTLLTHLEKPGRELPEYRRIWSILADTMPGDPPPGLTWGDARIGNMMVNDEFELEALLDWEQPSLGGSLQDLGWWLFSQRVKVQENDGILLPGIPDHDETVAIWAAASGIEPRDVWWYEAFAGLKTAALAVNIMDMRGQVPEDGNYNRSPMIRAVQMMLAERGLDAVRA